MDVTDKVYDLMNSGDGQPAYDTIHSTALIVESEKAVGLLQLDIQNSPTDEQLLNNALQDIKSGELFVLTKVWLGGNTKLCSYKVYDSHEEAELELSGLYASMYSAGAKYQIMKLVPVE